MKLDFKEKREKSNKQFSKKFHEKSQSDSL